MKAVSWANECRTESAKGRCEQSLGRRSEEEETALAGQALLSDAVLLEFQQGEGIWEPKGGGAKLCVPEMVPGLSQGSSSSGRPGCRLLALFRQSELP